MAKKIVIAGFPGTGKSTASEIFGDAVIDLESSNYHWIITDSGNKVLHPEWPDNYVRAICAVANETDGLADYARTLYVCCSTHNEVLTALMIRKQPFVIVCPKTDHNSMLQFLDRYRERNSPPEFINAMRNNWNKYMEDIKSYNIPVIYTMQYIGNILSIRGAYAYLLAKVQDVERYIYNPSFDIDTYIDDFDINHIEEGSTIESVDLVSFCDRMIEAGATEEELWKVAGSVSYKPAKVSEICYAHACPIIIIKNCRPDVIYGMQMELKKSYYEKFIFTDLNNIRCRTDMSVLQCINQNIKAERPNVLVIINDDDSIVSITLAHNDIPHYCVTNTNDKASLSYITNASRSHIRDFDSITDLMQEFISTNSSK